MVRFIHEKAYIGVYSILQLTLKKIELGKIDTGAIKKLIVEIGSPIIPLTLIFERLGFGGVTGIEWGILAGAVSALATEMGYEVQKLGRSVVLIRRRKDTAQKTEVPDSADYTAPKEDLESSGEDVQKK
jgi:hypothetical protein